MLFMYFFVVDVDVDVVVVIVGVIVIVVDVVVVDVVAVVYVVGLCGSQCWNWWVGSRSRERRRTWRGKLWRMTSSSLRELQWQLVLV